MTWLGDERVAPIVAGSDEAFLAVQTERGPHVTPHRVVASGGRLWFTTSRQARKVSALRRRGRAGVLMRTAHGAVIAGGSVSILDPVDPLGWLLVPNDVARSGRAALRLLTHHVRDVVGYGLTAGRLPLGWLPTHRVLLCFSADRMLVLDRDGVVVQRRGPWEKPVAPVRSGSNGDLRAGSAEGYDVDGDGALAWGTPSGPVVVPARCTADVMEIDVPEALSTVAGADAAAAAFVVSHVDGMRPTDKSGTLLRGRARLGVAEDSRTTVIFAPDTVTRWSGFESETVDARDPDG